MKPLVIGVGNRWRCDDGVGPRAIDALAAEARDDVELLILDGEPARLVDAWAGRASVVVVDAVRGGASPGTVHRVDALGGDLAVAASPSTHGAGVAAAVALGRALGRLPERLVVLGTEPACVGDGGDLSAPVAAAFDELVRRAAEEVATACA
ncbi:MAG: hydrogenase maturation protease [Acidimicrobiia bacterium]|nr:hydrogenase maturation protease [Acidimicrobiia bacterium]